MAGPVNVVTLSDYLVQKALGNTPVFVDGAGAVADTLSLADYNANKKTYVKSAENANYKLHVNYDGSKFSDYKNVLNATKADLNVTDLVPTQASGSSVDIKFADYKGGLATATPFIADLHAAGIHVNMVAATATFKDYTAAVAKLTGTDTVVFAAAKSNSPAITEFKLVDVTTPDPNPTAQGDKADAIAALDAAGYTFKFTIPASNVTNVFDNYVQAQTDTAGLAKVTLVVPKVTNSPSADAISASDYLDNPGFVKAAEAAGYKLKVIVDIDNTPASDIEKIFADKKVTIVESDGVTKLPLSVTLAAPTAALYEQAVADFGNAASIATIKFPAAVTSGSGKNSPIDLSVVTDYTEHLDYIKAAEAAKFKFKIVDVDPTTTVYSDLALLFNDPKVAVTLKPGSAVLDITSGQYSQAGVITKFAAEAQKAGYSLNVTLDSNVSTAADYKLLLKDVNNTTDGKAATIASATLDDKVVVLSIADFNNSKNAALITALEDAGYEVHVQPKSLSITDFNAAVTAAGGADKVFIPDAVPGVTPAGLTALSVTNFTLAGNAAYLKAITDAGYTLNVTADSTSLVDYGAAANTVQTSLYPESNVLVPKGTGLITIDLPISNFTGNPDYVAAAKAAGHPVKVIFSPNGAGASLSVFQQLLDAKVQIGIFAPSTPGQAITGHLTSAEYFQYKNTYVKQVEAAKYSLTVDFDPTKDTLANYKSLLADGKVTINIKDFVPGDQAAPISLTDFQQNSSGTNPKAYVTALAAKGYVITVTLGGSGTESDLWNNLTKLVTANNAIGTPVDVSIALSNSQIGPASLHAHELALAGVVGIAGLNGESLTVDSTQLDAFAAEGIIFNDPFSDVTLTIGAGDVDVNGDLGALIGTSTDENVDHFDIQGAVEVTLSDAQASALITEGINFASDDNVVLDHAGGSHVSTTLKDLQKLGVTMVHAAQAAEGHDLVIDANNGSTAALMADLGAALPQFGDVSGPGDLDVELRVDPTQIGDVADNAQHIADAGIDYIGSQFGDMNVTLDQAEAIDGAGLAFGNSGAAGYDPDVTLNVQAPEVPDGIALDQVIATATDVNVDHIDVQQVGDLTPTVHVTVEQAESMIDAGISFATHDHVVLDVVGTQLNTTKTPVELHNMGVDVVKFDATGLGAAFDDMALPNYGPHPGLSVDLQITDVQASTIANPHFAPTHGINEVSIDLTASLADNTVLGTDGIMDSNLQLVLDADAFDLQLIVDGNAGTLGNVIDAADGTNSLLTTDISTDGLVLALQHAGIVNIDLAAGSSISLHDQEVSELLNADLLSANQGASVDLTIDGTTSQVSLSEMSALGVDTVHLAQASTLIKLGDDNVHNVNDLVDYFKNQYQGPDIIAKSDPKTLTLDVGSANISDLLSNAEAVQELKLIGVDKVIGEDAAHKVVTKTIPN